MPKPLFSPVAGLIQDILLLTSVFLIAAALAMLAALRICDYLEARKRRKAILGRMGLPIIQ